eukprot:gene10057-18699_t
MMWKVSSRSTLLMHFNDIKSMESLSEFLLQFHESLLRVLSHCCLRLEDDLVANVLNCKKRFESSIGQNAPFMNRLENSIIKETCRKYAKILTWLNWNIMVRQNNNLVEFVAIKSTVVRNEFSEINDKMHFQEMKSEVKKLSNNSLSQRVYFLEKAKEGCSNEATNTDSMKPSKGLNDETFSNLVLIDGVHGVEQSTEEATAAALDQNMMTKLLSIQETVTKKLDEALFPLDDIDPVQGMEWLSNQRQRRVKDASTSPSKDDLFEEPQRNPTAKRNLFVDGAVGIWRKCISAHYEESGQSFTLKADTPVQNVQRKRQPRQETKQYGYRSKDQGGGIHELRRKWVAFVRRHRHNWKPTSKSVLCCVHFEPTCYEKRLDIAGIPSELQLKKNRLLKDSVPTIDAVERQIPKGPTARQRRQIKRHALSSSTTVDFEELTEVDLESEMPPNQ